MPLGRTCQLPECSWIGRSVPSDRSVLAWSVCLSAWGRRRSRRPKAASASRQIAAPKIGRFERLFRVRAGLRSLSDRCPLCAHYSRSPSMRRFSKADVRLKDAYGRTRANSGSRSFRSRAAIPLRGSLILNSAPPDCFSARSCPLCTSTMVRAMDSPMPMPSALLVKNGSARPSPVAPARCYGLPTASPPTPVPACAVAPVCAARRLSVARCLPRVPSR